VAYGVPEELERAAAGFDAVVATAHRTAAWVSALDRPDGPRLGYYIQGFEPLMYTPGTLDFANAWDSYTLPGLIRFSKTAWTREQVRKHLGADVTPVGVSVDVDQFRPRPRALPRAGGRPFRIAAMVRPYSPYREPQLTVELLERARRRWGARVEIWLYGAAPREGDLGRLPVRFPHRLAGRLSPGQVAWLMNEVDLFVDFSSHQAMGLSALEAAACGAAVIVPRNGGAVEWAVNERNALVVDTSLAEECFGAMARLVESPDRATALGRAALADVAAYYPEAVALRILELLFAKSAVAAVLVALFLAVTSGRAAAADAASTCGIQGSAASSPIAGAAVAVSGTLTAALPELDGFFLEDPACDADPLTSNALFVYDPRGLLAAVEADVGTWLAVTGEVKEYYGLTEVVAASVAGLDRSATFDPVLLRVPADPIAAAPYLESREAMVVGLLPSAVVGPTNRFGEAFVVPRDAGITRLFDPTDPRRVGVIPSGPWWPLDVGDELGPLVGPLTYTFGRFKIALLEADRPRVEPASREPVSLAPAPAGALRVATYNLENLFDAVDDPATNDDEWTLDAAAYDAAVALRARSIAAFLGDPDVIGVQEVETLQVLETLAAQPVLAASGYRAALVEGFDERGTDVGFLYRASRLELEALVAEPACVPGTAADERSACALAGGGAGVQLFPRPPLRARFRDRASRRDITVIVNHLTSMRGGEPTAAVRTAQAAHLRRVAEAETADVTFVIGDLNDIPGSEPLRALLAGGFLQDLHGLVAVDDNYSYVHNGVSQVLDYVLVRNLTPVDVVDAGPRHINADFAVPADQAAADGHRAADHDPVVVTLAFAARSAFLPAAYNRGTAAYLR
jgi:glycosyltransferase involved in cell wall biosynthesis/endonuclease/exonuclease/phosphatase family metal-dependent hydrolase